MEQPAAVDGGDEDIVAAVVVVVGDGGAESVDVGGVEAAAGEDIVERAVAIVAVEAMTGAPPAGVPILAVDEQQVGPSVAVNIQHSDAAAEQLGVNF